MVDVQNVRERQVVDVTEPNWDSLKEQCALVISWAEFSLRVFPEEPGRYEDIAVVAELEYLFFPVHVFGIIQHETILLHLFTRRDVLPDIESLSRFGNVPALESRIIGFS